MDKMDKNEAISIIEGLYPADDDNYKTAEIGKRLLEQAEMELNNWRSKPLEILVRYADLCQQEDTKQTNKLLKNTRGY